MRLFVWLAVLVGCAVVQTSFRVAPGGVPLIPDLLLVAVTLLAVHGEGESVYLLAPLAGYLKDVYSGGTPGGSLLVFALLVYFIRGERNRLDFESYLLDVVVVVATLLDAAAAFLPQVLSKGLIIDVAPLAGKVAVRALSNVLFAELVRSAWKRLGERRQVMATRRRFGELG